MIVLTGCRTSEIVSTFALKGLVVYREHFLPLLSPPAALFLLVALFPPSVLRTVLRFRCVRHLPPSC